MMQADNWDDRDAAAPAAPPAYESINFESSNSGLPDVPRDEFAKNASIAVSVTNPTKVGDGLSAYAVYTVSTKTSDAAYKKSEMIVVRRYSDLQWLRGRLSSLYPGVVIFPLPEKTVTTSPFQSDFLEHRRGGLQDFMKKVVEHHTLGT